ncbi:MAG: lipid II flippase MurJ, partial [Desulfovibrionaceae bacterium]|nr:lipid II flippase MurJ [Desulfovibrionaceae bacterium]
MGILARTQGMGMAALLLAASAIISRFMGLVREKFISWQFGAGSEADVYFAAFVVPDIINYLLAGGFMSITLIPLLSKRFAEDEADAWKFFSTVLTWMTLAAVGITCIALAFVGPLSHIAAPGLAEPQSERLQFFMCMTLPTQIFFLTGSCVSALLFLRRQFIIPALAPLIYNGCIISSVVGLQQLGLVQGMTGYCVGVAIGSAIGTLLLPLY